MAAAAAALLFVTMFLPWYQQNVVVSGAAAGALQSQRLTAFGVFSFVEAAVLLVAVAVLVLLFARAERRAFHLPGGDGLIVTIAGGWVALLLVWRLFDKPELQGAGVGNMGIEWGIFFALAAAGLLASAGLRMRATDRPEPPAREPRPRRPRTPPGTEVTRPLPPERELAGDDRRAAASSPPPPPPTEPLPEPRLPDPPTQRLPDRPTERRPEPPTQRLARAEPQRERLWDDH